MVEQAIFQVIVAMVGALSASGCAVLYFKYVRLDRPAVGVFNMRDIGVLLLFIITLPLLYLILPQMGLTIWLVLTFTGAMYFGLRPLLRPRYVWPIIAVLLGADIWITYNMLGRQMGWQIYWSVTSIVMLLVVVSVANLYIQGGMRLRHIAWFALVLSVYDFLTATVFPLSQQLADRFIGRPLDPSIGFRWSFYNANIGLGDLLVYCCFAIAAYKGFGKRGLIAAFIIIPIFGAILPGSSSLFIGLFVRGSIGIVVPAQTFFGPAAFVTYFILARRSQERSMKEWQALEAAQGKAIRPGSRILRRVAERPALAEVQRSAQGAD